MRNKRRMIISSVLFIAAGLCLLIACEKEESVTLAAPVNIAAADETLTWDEVPHAQGYVVELDGTAYDTQTNSLDIFLLTNQYKTYSFRVMARGDGERYVDSSWTAFEYTLPRFYGWKLKPIEHGASYEISVKDPSEARGKIIVPSYFIDPTSSNRIPITRIASHFLYNAEEVTAVLLPDSIRTIGSAAFGGCSSLSKIRLSQNLESIETGAFVDSALTEITLPASVNSLAEGCFLFDGCTDLVSVTVDEKNEYYRSESNCIIRNQDDVLIAAGGASVIPDTVKRIGEFAFSGQRNLTEVTVPASVTEISDSAFARCTGLKRVVFSEGLKFLGNSERQDWTTAWWGDIFYGCSALTDVSPLPASLEYLTGDVFAQCPGVTVLTVSNGNPAFRSENNCIISKTDNVLVAGCAGSIIPAGITAVGGYAFYRCRLGDVVIPEGVTEIRSGAFSESTITGVTFPESLQKIESIAFCTCLNLVSVAIPEGVTEIGRCAFFECYGLSVTLPESVQSIGKSAFYLSTIYTSSHDLYPSGWAKEKVGSSSILSSLPWCDLCSVYLDCELAYDGAQPYVRSYSFYITEIDGVRYFPHGGYDGQVYFIPARAGYEFAGWATEEGSAEVVYGKKYTPFQRGSVVYPRYSSLDYVDDLLALPRDEISYFYAVWIPISN